MREERRHRKMKWEKQEWKEKAELKKWEKKDRKEPENEEESGGQTTEDKIQTFEETFNIYFTRLILKFSKYRERKALFSINKLRTKYTPAFLFLHIAYIQSPSTHSLPQLAIKQQQQQQVHICVNKESPAQTCHTNFPCNKVFRGSIDQIQATFRLLFYYCELLPGRASWSELLYSPE